MQSQASRHGSFSSQYSNMTGMTSPMGSQSSSTHGNPSQPPPSTGPLSASDPRTQLLVSNLPYRVRWQDLKDLFRKAGTVLRADVSLSPDNRSRGYGSVLMATEEDALKATEMLGGFTWQGRTLEVRIDRSGALVGVAGSAVTFGPNAVTGQTPPINGQGFANLRSAGIGAGGVGSYLNVPHMASHSGDLLSPALSSASSLNSPHGSLPGARSSSFSSMDSGQTLPGHDGMTDFESGFMQGQMRRASSFQQQAQNGGSPQPTNSLYAHASASGISQQQGGSGYNRGGDVSALAGQAAWNGASDPSIQARYTANPGGSSVPTGMPGTAAVAPWPAGPSMGGMNVQAQAFGSGYGLGQSAPSNTGTTSYAGRVLFVGNLPFHCQWQDLKDLFRAAGNIQRADVAIGPEGRSRGFGTVLFTSQEDAQNAVRLYHGYEYSGRTLKVHFDRFAAQNGPAVGTPGAPSQYTGAFAAAQPPSHVNHSSRMSGYPSQAHQHSSHLPASHQQQQHQSHTGYNQYGMQAATNALGGMQSQTFSALGPSMPSSNGYAQQRTKNDLLQPSNPINGTTAAYETHLQQHQYEQHYQQLLQSQGAQQQQQGQHGHYHQSGSDQSALQPQQQSAAQPSRRQDSMSLSLSNQGGINGPLAYLPSDLMSPGLTSPPAPMYSQNSGASRPGRIQLPPMGFSNATSADMSPMNPRMSVPMTPGMPGFTFHAVPQTPPLYPQFLSPGLGPFSPPLGDPNIVPDVLGNDNAGFPGFINAAPGAPLHAANATTPGAPTGYNPMFPLSGVYAGDGQNQRQPHAHATLAASQQQTATPHWSQDYRPQRGSQRSTSSSQVETASDNARVEDERSFQDRRSDIAKTPGAGPRRAPDAGLVRRASDGTPGAVTPPAADGYPFPMVVAQSSALLTRRASTNSPAGTPQPHPADENDAQIATSVTNDALVSQNAEELAKTIARLSVKGAALAKDASAKRSLSMTTERSAAANAMARLREKAGTPTLTGRAVSTQSESGEENGFGAPYEASDGPDGSLSARRRLGLNNPENPSPLSNSQLASLSPGSSAGGSAGLESAFQPQTESMAFRAARESLLGVSVPSGVLEAATSGSALDTSSTPEGSLKSTPAEESGPEQNGAQQANGHHD